MPTEQPNPEETPEALDSAIRNVLEEGFDEPLPSADDETASGVDTPEEDTSEPDPPADEPEPETEAPEPDSEPEPEDEPDDVEPESDPDENEDDDATPLAAQLETLAGQYGVDPKVMGQFQSAEEAQRAMALWDHQFRAEGQRYLEQIQQDPEQPAPPQQPVPQPPVQQQPPKVEIDLSQFDEDDPTRKYIEYSQQQMQQLQARLDQVDQRAVQREQQYIEEETRRVYEHASKIVDQLADEYDMVDVFGRSGEMTQAQSTNRGVLFNGHDAFKGAYLARNMDSPDTEALLRRAIQFDFQADLAQRQQKKRQAKVAKQSKRRLGAPGRAKPEPKDFDGPLEEDQILHDLYHSYESQGA